MRLRATEDPALRKGSRNDRTGTSGCERRHEGLTAQFAELQCDGRRDYRVRLVSYSQLDKTNIDFTLRSGQQCAAALGLRNVARTWLYIVYIRKQ